MACTSRRHDHRRAGYCFLDCGDASPCTPRDHGASLSPLGLSRPCWQRGRSQRCLRPWDREFDPFRLRLSRGYDDGRMGLLHDGARPHYPRRERVTAGRNARLGQDAQLARPVWHAPRHFPTLAGGGERKPTARQTPADQRCGAVGCRRPCASPTPESAVRHQSGAALVHDDRCRERLDGQQTW
ncbi:hypothetical protein SMALB_5025 [Streptomyces malaysiensis]|uniref:Uncharacterized protein n=1 Tax=Streptomyces malaysiensis TaxID=92644 RepID=A0A7X5X5K8_STRMQ|nr:hypothetical protein [Streptomyces malaysiensis]